MGTSPCQNGGTREHPETSERCPNFLNFLGFDQVKRLRTERRSTQECNALGAILRLFNPAAQTLTLC